MLEDLQFTKLIVNYKNSIVDRLRLAFGTHMNESVSTIWKFRIAVLLKMF